MKKYIIKIWKTNIFKLTVLELFLAIITLPILIIVLFITCFKKDGWNWIGEKK